VDGRVIAEEDLLPAMLEFRFKAEDNPLDTDAVGGIDQEQGMVYVVAPLGTALNPLKASITTNLQNVYTPREQSDFTQNVPYTITSATHGQKNYTVSVIAQTENSARIFYFGFEKADNAAAGLGASVSGIIDEAAKNITLIVPFGTALDALSPHIVHSGQNISPENGEPEDFSNSLANPAPYTVTSADETTTVVYHVRVTVGAVNEWASAPSINLSPENGELDYTITPSNPAADSYDVYWIAGNQTSAAMIKAGGTRIAGASTTGTITGLTNDAFYSVIVTAHKTGYAECDSASASESPLGPLANAERRFVKVGGAGSGSGTSWEDASGNIQSMMDELVAGGEIWVAAGKYTPGSTRESTFALKDNVKVYGGFPAGITTATPLELAMRNRNARFNTVGIISDDSCETILSGDINNNDTYELSTGFLTAGYNGNTYHVVTGANAVMDGFTIKGGYADGTDYVTGNGGGIYNYGSSLTLSNLTITGNSVGIYDENSTDGYGGGIFNGYNSKIILTNATITSNKVDGTGSPCGGGGMANVLGTAILTNVTIAGNKVDGTGDDSYGIGGGIYNYGYDGKLILTNVAITGNEARGYGGGIVGSNDARTILTNVTIAGNRAANGGGIYNAGSVVNIRNSILWGNTSSDGGAQVYIYSTTKPLTWSHCLVEGSGGSSGPWNTDFGTDDGNNIDSAADPFVSSVPASSAPTKAGNYRLGGAVGVNAGNNSPSVPAYLTYVYWPTDLMGDWATYYNSLTDLDGLTRKVGGIVDMGAYEKQ
jgi:hypothetical protein